ncbi:MAG: OmpA family protein [Thermoanaerobaculales bacterium]|nr:OmpA family protein [Thermoanaerobaculales bacterium]
MRKFVSPAVVILLVAGLAVTGCASKKYVQEQVANSEAVTNGKIGEVQTSVETNQKEISALHQKDAEMQAQLDKLSVTAKEALERAQAAGKLAEGTFIAEVLLTDQDVRFGFDNYSLSDEAKAAIDAFAEKVIAKNIGAYLEIQGHTDSIGSESYNLSLGYRRAEAVMRYLGSEKGFPLHRMNVTSYGEFKPIADNGTAEGRSQNRRVALVLMR